MGLSIYYKGSFKKDASLSDMIDEVRDIAEIHNWKYHIFETEFSNNDFRNKSFSEKIYGISVSPPNCEPIEITFLSNGRMCSPIHLELFGNSNDKENYSHILFSKTQYAGFEIHQLIIDMLKYLNKKYFHEFELTDESKYWETGDEKILRQSFQKYNDMIDIFSHGLENISKKANESIEDFVIRVAKNLRFK